VADIEPHDTWPDPLDDLCHGVRIGVEQCAVATRVTFERAISNHIDAGTGGRARSGVRIIEYERMGKIALVRNILAHAER
jgi:hypothetical protein